MGPWLAVAGVLLTLLGIVVLWRHRRGEDDHSAHEHGGEQVAWLLLAPVLALLLIAPARSVPSHSVAPGRRSA